MHDFEPQLQAGSKGRGHQCIGQAREADRRLLQRLPIRREKLSIDVSMLLPCERIKREHPGVLPSQNMYFLAGCHGAHL